MNKAFVFGKFMPFHKGHEAMINFALARCDFLTILICCSDKEQVPCAVRKTWIEQTFENLKNLEVRTFSYSEDEFPNTSVSSEEISAIWAAVFKKQFPGYSILVTSEPYGNFVAGYMAIRHIEFDPCRSIIPVSASLIKKDQFSYWEFLPDSVKPYYSIKIVILGTESTGKTTLTKQLSQHYNCGFVSEAAREIIPNSNAFIYADLHLVAKEHAGRIDAAVRGPSPLVIIDTDVHTTKSYSKFIFGKELAESSEIYNSNRAVLYLYLNNDVPHSQDGTRLNETDRNLLDISHREVLRENNIDFIEITGNWNERFEKAVKHIDKLIINRPGDAFTNR